MTRSSAESNILIVDDNPGNLKTLASVLMINGYRVRPLLNGELALKSIQKNPPDLILLDIIMPDMNGYEVCSQLKADEKTRDIPIIFISALNEVFDKVEAFAHGCVDYITKPFQSEEVLVRVRTHIDLRNLQKRLGDKNIRLQQEILNREHTEEKLRESEGRYRSLFKNNHTAMLVIEPDTGNIIEANPAACNFYGYGEEEIKCFKINDINILSEEEIFQEMQRAKKEQRNCFIFKHRLADGKIRDVEVHSSPVAVNGKKFLFSFIYDITEIKHIQESQSRLVSIVESSEDAVIGKTLKGIIFEWNKGAEKLYEYTRAEARGQSVSIIFPEEKIDEIPQMIERVCQGEHIFQETFRIKKSGEKCYVSLRMFPIKDISGNITGISSISRDITERIRAEDTLRESEERFRAIFQNAGIGIYLTDIAGLFIQVNPALQKMMKYTESELSGMYFWELTHPDDCEKSMALFRELTEGKISIFRMEKRLFRKDNKTVWANTVVSLIRNAEEKPRFILGLVEDITERKQVQKELEKAREQAEAASRAKSEFLAKMSHEIRTPMNAVIGLSHLAMNTGLTEKQYDYINKISMSAHALLGIIDDILDFSRIEAGSLKPESIIFCLKEIMEDLYSFMKINAEKKGINISFTIEKNVPDFITGDPLRLRQILINLIANAVKFTEKGEILVETQIIKENQKSVVIQFSIKDTGIGMTEKEISILFQPFSQADDSITRKYGGTGLGLAICRRLADIMKGEILVKSEPGKGSTFTFSAEFGIHKENENHKGESKMKNSESLNVKQEEIILPAQKNHETYLNGNQVLPENLPEIDIKSGLKRVGGDYRLYKKILFEFCRDYADSAYKIKAFIDAEDMKKILPLIHSIKGQAGQIGAENLYISACNLESGIIESRAKDYEALFKNFEAVLNPVLQSIEYLDKIENDPLKTSKNPDHAYDVFTIKPILLKLDSFLQEGDFEASEYMTANKKYLMNSFIKEAVQKLDYQVSRFEFEKAGETLAEIIRRLDIS